MINFVTGFHLPKQLGTFEIEADEVMYYLYLPVKVPGGGYPPLPDKRLQFLSPLLLAVADDNPGEDWADKYVYVTVKKMFVGGGMTANRPGWHCDGYLSDDLNYVWYDCVPTWFTNNNNVALPPFHNTSLRDMELLSQYFESELVTYPNKQLLKLDDKVLHAVNTNIPEQIMRTFVKITVSKNRFNLKGNSKNPLLPDNGPFYERSLVRNDPHQAQRDHYEPTPEDDHFK